jgi:serine/threonine protein kinase
MFGKVFGSKSGDGKPRRSRVNLDKRFVVVSLTAQGSMSRVQRVMDNETGRTVCLKVQLVAKHEAAAARAARDGERPEEGEIGQAVVHPHVVRTFECGVSTKGEHYLVMEYIDGVSLQFIRESNAADLNRKLDLLRQSAEGLAAVHAAGFIHHDINPRNFLVHRDGDVKLIDFGLAVPNTPAFRRPGNRTGTLSYMAPELIRREATDERIDIFSFGAMAFELLTGRLPYESSANNSLAMMLQRINHEPLDPSVAEPRLHPALAALLRRMIARRKEERYASMNDFIRDLDDLPREARVLRAPSRHAAMCSYAGVPTNDDDDDEPDAPPTSGVYMMKAGPMYLIRKSRDFERRIHLIRQQYGDKVELIHTIPASNIDRAEDYWHTRFHEKRGKGEWFALSDEDVAHFKACARMGVDGSAVLVD